MKVVWFKRDLRLHDHEALHEALSTSGKTLLLYIFEPSLMKDYHYSQRHFDIIKQSLEALQKELQKYHTQIYMWYGNTITGGNANVTFQNGKVVGKAQVGLK